MGNAPRGMYAFFREKREASKKPDTNVRPFRLSDLERVGEEPTEEDIAYEKSKYPPRLRNSTSF